MTTKKFQRNPRAHRRADRSDKTGTVQVAVYLRGDRGAYMKGNLFRSFSVVGAKVSEVADALEALIDSRGKRNGRTEANATRKAAAAG